MMPANSAVFEFNSSYNELRAGKSWFFVSRAAAKCMAVGNVSLEL